MALKKTIQKPKRKNLINVYLEDGNLEYEFDSENEQFIIDNCADVNWVLEKIRKELLEADEEDLEDEEEEDEIDSPGESDGEAEDEDVD